MSSVFNNQKTPKDNLFFNKLSFGLGAIIEIIYLLYCDFPAKYAANDVGAIIRHVFFPNVLKIGFILISSNNVCDSGVFTR